MKYGGQQATRVRIPPQAGAHHFVVAITMVALMAVVGAAAAQSGRPGSSAASSVSIAAVSGPPTGRAGALIDLTGYWVSVITQDWRYRVVVPGKGEYVGIPLNRAAKDFADGWDAAADEAAGQTCKGEGVAALMRQPERLHITWQDEDTLKVETDTGQQTRLLHFNASAAQAPVPSLQGFSIATWVLPSWGPARDPASGGAKKPKLGSLKVTTSRILPGYLRKNGVPYSDQTTMVEYWDLHQGPANSQWLSMTVQVTDPTYLQVPYIYAPNFKKELDGSKWSPTPCSLRW